jgi:hypothetical protein
MTALDVGRLSTLDERLSRWQKIWLLSRPRPHTGDFRIHHPLFSSLMQDLEEARAYVQALEVELNEQPDCGRPQSEGARIKPTSGSTKTPVWTLSPGGGV